MLRDEMVVPLLMLKKFYRVPEADSISSELHLHKKQVFRFSQMHIYPYKGIESLSQTMNF